MWPSNYIQNLAVLEDIESYHSYQESHKLHTRDLPAVQQQHYTLVPFRSPALLRPEHRSHSRQRSAQCSSSQTHSSSSSAPPR